MKDNSVIDQERRVMRCTVCGDEVPMPLGEARWVAAVMTAFARAHGGAGDHGGGRTMVWQNATGERHETRSEDV